MTPLLLATASEPECDGTQALVANEGGGCALRVTVYDGWLEVGVLALVLVIGALFALVALNVRR